jgi:tetratricopeptide (TPR) repeat protein
MAEKSLNELPRDLRPLYTKGNDALQRDNFEYAIDLFTQVLAREPSIYECRKALRTAQLRKAGSSGGGFFRKAFSSASASPLVAKGQLALHKDPAEALQIAEHILNGDPNNSSAHKLVVEAALRLEMPHTAVMSLEVLHRNSPRDKETTIRFANALAETGEASRAERILGELYRANPSDNELAQALKNLSARKTMDEGGYDDLADGKGSYRDILKDKDEAVSLEQQNRQVKSEDVAERLIREYEARLRTEPRNVKLLRDLAELYTQKKNFDKALSYYQQIKGTDVGADANLDRAIADTTIRKLEFQIAQLDPNHPDYPETVARLQAEKDAYQLAECQKRVEKFPTDLGLRFELGQLYFQNNKISEAISEFQKAQANPHRRVQTLSYLAQCFGKRNMNDLAARTLQTALKEKLVFDDEKKELIYLLGCVLEKMGKTEDAIEQFKLIYEVDIGYRDVSQKVDAYYSSKSS